LARLNIEDKFFSDPRFIELCISLGDKFKAVGVMIMAWRLAQKWYLTPERLIPISEWKKANLPDEIYASGLAEKIDGKVRVMGSDEHFSWILKCREAGKRGSLKRLENSSRVPSPDPEGSQASLLFTLSSKKKEILMPEQNKKISKPEQINLHPAFVEIKNILQPRKVSLKLQTTWIDLYEDTEWIIYEIKKANAWEVSHPCRKKKNFGAFLNNWLSNASPRKQKSQKPVGFSAAELMQKYYPTHE
jgi:hypothetical protein